MFSRKKRQRRSDGGRGLWFVAALSGLLLVYAMHVRAGDRVHDLQEKFDHETHAGGKIKWLDRLADAQFEAATTDGKAGNYSSVGLIFEKYRDNVRTAYELLIEETPIPDKHPGGYRQLEIQVRRGIRETEQTLLIVPDEYQPPLQIVRQDLIAIDDKLLKALFPDRSKQQEVKP